VEKLTLKIINQSKNPLPAYSTAGASGMDLRANIEEDITLAPLQRALVATGLFVEIPLGYEIQVRPRSGLAIKQGITCLNSPGTVDADYRGELKVILINLSSQQQVIKTGDRIAQMVLQQVVHANLQQVDELSETSRGDGGFGHTGKH
jgi:dUTP pyrophosphatase